MINIKKIWGAVALFALMIGSANAFIIDSSTSTGDTFTVDWLLSAGSTDPNGNTNLTGYDIQGEALFTFLGADTTFNTLSFDITLSNTTATNTAEIGLQKFGFGTTPDATSVVFSDALDDGVIDATLGTAPEFPDKALIDLLAVTGTGAGLSIQAGESDTFNILIGFSALANDFSVEFDPFNVKYQTSTDSFEFGTSVPEPSVFALMGLGLVGLGFSRRRK